MNKIDPVITVVTTTYNRKELTERCYNSLFAQTCFDFEWVLVDDGSTDGTEEHFQKLFDGPAPFARILVRKENGGKSSALNAAHPYMHGKYMLILDSDDILAPNAVETAIKEWNGYSGDPEIGLLIFQKVNPEGKVFASTQIERVPVDFMKRRVTIEITNDWCEVVRTEIFTKYPIPLFEGENYITGAAMWYRIGADYKCVYINKPLEICSFQEGGLTKSGRPLHIRNPKGETYCSLLRMNPRGPLSYRLRSTIAYICFGTFSGKTFHELLRDAKGSRSLVLLCCIPGKLRYLQYKNKYKIK